jgi:uncharacterized protein YoxC
MTDKEITIEIIQQPDIVIELNEQGPQGPAGPIGPQGLAGTVQVGNTYTQPYGEDSRVVNRGTAQSALLDFYLTEGPQGIPGQVGPAGGTHPVYNANTSTLEFYTWNYEGDLLPPQVVKYVSELENDIGYITNNDIVPLQNTVSNNTSRISTLEDKVDMIDSDVEVNTSDINTANTNINNLDGRTGLLETKSTELQTQVNANTNNINTLNTEVGDVGTALNELNGEDI